MEKINFNIIDIECLYDFFSFQFRTNEMKKAQWITCERDEEFHKLYKVLYNAKLPMYCFSINYDKFMLNMVCKLVEKQYTNINYHLRTLNNLFMQGLDYFRLNKIFWCDNYFVLKEKWENNENKEGLIKPDQWFDQSINNCLKTENKAAIEFLNNYSDLLGKSQVFKQLNICDIPKMMFYYTVDKDGKLKHNLSLKKLQLYFEGLNIKFDFSKYQYMKDIKKNKLYETFKVYSLNDVDFLYRFFTNTTKNGKSIKNYPLKQLETRLAACEVVKKFNKYFVLNNDMIHSENNTKLINEILKIENPQKSININYTKFIKTEHEKFNKLVKFVEENQFIKKDYELKTMYNDYVNTMNKHIETKNIVLNDGTIEQIVENMDIINVNEVDIKIGLGGLHGAIENYNGTNLDNIDYTSLYPSVILQYKSIFKNIINIDLYEQIYNYRVEGLKPTMKRLKSEIKDNKPELKLELDKLSIELNKIDSMQNGIKLILNSTFGLINSSFNLPISCKQLGRFITLKCQSILFNLMSKMSKTTFVNVNTDGLIFENNLKLDIQKLITKDKEQNGNGYIKLEYDKINMLIQKHVNCYILVDEYNNLKLKGDYNPSIKDIINKNGKFINLQNVLNIIKKKEIEIFPIYINQKYIKLENELFSKDVKDVPLYLTSLEKGVKLIKTTKQPKVVNNCGEIMYFTTKKEDASILQYNYHAQILHNAIKNHCVEEEVIKHYLKKLTPEQNDLRLHKLRLGKRINKKLLSVMDNSNKRLIKLNKPTQLYTWYTNTNILSSKQAAKIVLEKNENYKAILVDKNDIAVVNKLKKIGIIRIHIKNNKNSCFIIDKTLDINLTNVTILNTVIPLYSKDENITYEGL